MSNNPSRKAVVFDANLILGALSASNPDLPDEILHEILRSMISQGQVEVANLSSDEFPLKSRIRLPVSGLPVARKPVAQTSALQASFSQTGRNGQIVSSHQALGPKAAASKIGVSRSTLDNWRRAGLIIALPKGRNGHLIPIVQFVHSRPIEGIDDILSACSGDNIRAWMALTAPQSDGAPSAIDAAAAGDRRAIHDAIKRL